MNRQRMRAVLLFIAVVIILYIFIAKNPFSVSVDYRADAYGIKNIYSTSAAINECVNQRNYFINTENMDCESCVVTCRGPSAKLLSSTTQTYNGQTYTFDWSKCTSRDTGFARDMQIVTSYCNDAITVCTTGENARIVATSNSLVANGVVKTVEYTLKFTDCKGNIISGDSVNCDDLVSATPAQINECKNPSIQYQVTCNSGYTIKGVDYADSVAELGTCVPFNTVSGTIVSLNNDVAVSNNIYVGKTIRVSGTTTPAVDTGDVYIRASVYPASAGALSVVSKYSQEDACGKVSNVAGTWFHVNKGDTIKYEFDISSAGLNAGEYNIIVQYMTSCRMSANAEGVTTQIIKPLVIFETSDPARNVDVELPVVDDEFKAPVDELIAQVDNPCTKDAVSADGKCSMKCDANTGKLVQDVACKKSGTLTLLEGDNLYWILGGVVVLLLLIYFLVMMGKKR